MGKFGVGQAVRRVEDARLLTGAGRYTDDIHLDGQLYMALVRSPHAHAEIAAIDCDGARELPGVHGVYTVEDLDAAGLKDIPCLAPVPGKGGTKPIMPGHPILARGRVRHVGDPVAAVVAESRAAAQEAVEAVMVDYEPLPHVIDGETAVSADAPQIWPDARNNVCLEFVNGDPGATEQAMAKAAHVTTVKLRNPRIVANSMEPRGAIGAFDPESGRFTLHASTQGSHQLRPWLAKSVFGMKEDRLHIVTPDVGGGFGTKIFLYAEYALVLFAARELGRPVRWIGERTESFQSDAQGRDHTATLDLGVDSEQRIVALRLRSVANMGAYLSNFAPAIPTGEMTKMLSGVYAIPAVSAEVTLAFTNTVPVDAYRGAGRPEAAYFVERTMDAAARELGLDPWEFRRKNFIAPEQMPYTTATGITYDSGEFARLMDEALKIADVDGLESRKAEARKRGKLHGLGMAYYIEACAAVGSEDARVTITDDGDVELDVGTQSNGQGHATAYAQILSDKLDIEPDRIHLRQGDSDRLPSGGGTEGSRSLLMGGGATGVAGDNVVEKIKKLASHLMEVAPADLELADGDVVVAGTDKRMTLAELARSANAPGLPDELSGALTADGHYDAPGMTYPNGCHICEVEVDEATGTVAATRYIVVDDFGKVVNPLLVEGQVHGGTAQGLGQALFENTTYEEESGQLVTATYMDYTIPRADGIPLIELHLIEVPCATNPMGIKGAGEAGAIGAPPACINALLDALAPYGVRHIDMPATPEKVWQVMQDSQLQEAAK